MIIQPVVITREENNNDEPSKTDHSKEGSSIDAEVIKGIQAQIASLAQRDELKKVGAVRPYCWNLFLMIHL